MSSSYKNSEYSKYEFREREEGEQIYWLDIYDCFGLMVFSFDKETLYNFHSEYDELTPEQKAIFRKENPTLAELKEG